MSKSHYVLNSLIVLPSCFFREGVIGCMGADVAQILVELKRG